MPVTSLTQLRNNLRDYCARRDAAQAKIDVLEELRDTLSDKKLQVELSLNTVDEIGYIGRSFSDSAGDCVGTIQYIVHCDEDFCVYSRVSAYYDALDDLIDQINVDLSGLRSEKAADIGVIDDISSQIDLWWTEHVSNAIN